MASEVKIACGAAKRPCHRGGKKLSFTTEQAQKLRKHLAYGDTPRHFRDRALFGVMISSGLRVSDVLALRPLDVLDGNGIVRADFTVKQIKTGGTVECRLSPDTRLELQAWLAVAKPAIDGVIFVRVDNGGLNVSREPLSTKTIRQTIKHWAGLLGLDARLYSTHTMRRSVGTLVYDNTNCLVHVQRVLGHRTPYAAGEYISKAQSEVLSRYSGFML